MKRLGLLILCGLTFAATASANEVSSVTQSFPLESSQSLSIKSANSDLSITGADTDAVTVTMTVACEKPSKECVERANKVALVSKTQSDALIIKLKHLNGILPGTSVKLDATVPRSAVLHVELRSGDVEARNLVGWVDLQVSFGDVDVYLNRSEVRSVDIDSKVGDVDLILGTETISGSGLVGSGVRWSQAEGLAALKVRCGVGDVVVHVEPSPES